MEKDCWNKTSDPADPSNLGAADSETTPDLENETRTFKWSARQENTTLRAKIHMILVVEIGRLSILKKTTYTH